MSIDELIEQLATRAHAERRFMVERANRSMGQIFRHARERIQRMLKHGN